MVMIFTLAKEKLSQIGRKVVWLKPGRWLRPCTECIQILELM